MRESQSLDRMRLDKWLWVARFYKTRSLASQAIDGGHVRLNGVVVKPSRDVKPGDAVEMSMGGVVWDVMVCGLNAMRRPAPEARLLYEETPESMQRRAQEQEARRIAPTPGSDLRGRPTKKDRRLIKGFRGDF